MILFIDNYDSFTYNLVDMIGQLQPDLLVVRNDRIAVEQIERLTPDAIVISPGPGLPQNAGISCAIIQHFFKKIPILGICLGHQAIGFVFDMPIIRSPYPIHGKTSTILHSGSGIFKNIESPIEATRYHSLIIDNNPLTEDLQVTAHSTDNLIMAVQHRQFPLTGLQFHPESILTPTGPQILANWLREVSRFHKKLAIKHKNDKITERG